MASLKSKTVSPIVIDLGQDIKIKQTTLVSSLQGEELAQKYDLPHVATESTAPLQVIIPHHVYGITSAFFFGMFGKLMKELGSIEAFRKRVTFHYEVPCVGDFIETNINEVWNRLHPQVSIDYEPADEY